MAPTEHDDGEEEVTPGVKAFMRGQLFLKQGKAVNAVKKLREALEHEDGRTFDTHLILAEALWQVSGGKGTDHALPHYEAATKLAVEAGDQSKEAMVSLGHGFALTQLGRTDDARTCLERAKKLAELEGNGDAMRFVDQMLEQLGGEVKPMDGPEGIRLTWSQFAKAVAAQKPAVLFLRGTLDFAVGEESEKGINKMKEARSTTVEVVDVCNPGDNVPEGLQGVANSEHLTFPQLYVLGEEVEKWMDLEAAALEKMLRDAGVPEPKAEPCHGTGAFAEGLEPWEVALVELVSQMGLGEWPKLTEALVEKGFGEDLDKCGFYQSRAEAVEVEWQRLAPLVKDKLENQPEMPCGHSCDTCPTRHDCQLHDAIDGKVKDIEDLMG